MTDYVITTSATVTSPAYQLLAGDTLSLAPSVLLAAPNATPITMAGGRSVIAGAITSSGGGYGVLYNSTGANTSGAQVVVTASGSVTAGSTAIGNLRALPSGGASSTMHSGGSVVNAGSIYSIEGAAVGLTSDASASSAAPVAVRNTGSISGQLAGVLTLNSTLNLWNSGFIESRTTNYAAVHSYSFGASTIVIENSGVISGAGAGISAETIQLSNSGLVTAGSGFSALQASSLLRVLNSAGGEIRGAVTASVNADAIDNFGRITGTVSLGAGADRLDNTYGVITGNIVAGQGDDTITGGAQRDVIYGDNVSGDTAGGADILVGNGGDDLIYGGYGNDQLYGNQGDDVLYGNQGDDWMHGGQGEDVLYGGQGTDVINGGKGDDVLYGNLGDDTFVFSAGFGHDVIGDFGVGAGDRIQFQPGTFADFADVQAHAQQLAGGVLLTTAVGDTVFLVGVAAGSLSAAQFAFG